MSRPEAKVGRTRSDSTRELLRTRALERGANRSDELRKRVRATLKTIEAEMASNDGIYPHKKGALSSAEVARRAGVHATTFFSPKQRDLGDEVRTWLKNLKKEKVVGRGPVRRELATRLADWKRLYDRLAQSHRDTELELQETERLLEVAQVRIGELEQQASRLQEALNASATGKVVKLPPRRT
jgi:hypothetical protein